MSDTSKEAFPRPATDGLNDAQSGLTLREWYAGKVLPVAAGSHQPELAAELALQYAGALLAALKVKP